VRKRNTLFFAGGIFSLMLMGIASAGSFEDARALYLSGDYVAAVRLLRPLAARGDAYAQFGLGLTYERGHGVEQDYAQAAVWYRKAAEHGLATAQYKLGVVLESGQGALQDYSQAYMWYDLAASHARLASSRGKASKARDLVAAKMTPVQIADAQRMARDWRPQR
jgi:TPR repeat protein